MNNDLISRRSAIDSIKKCLEVAHDNWEFSEERAYLNAIECLEEEPPIQPQQKTGHWLINSDGYYPYCSICKNEPQNRVMTKYCPNCGAKTKSEVTE